MGGGATLNKVSLVKEVPPSSKKSQSLILIGCFFISTSFVILCTATRKIVFFVCNFSSINFMKHLMSGLVGIKCGFIVTLVSDIRDLLTGFSSDKTNSPPSGLSHWLIHCQASQELTLFKDFLEGISFYIQDRRKSFTWRSQLFHVLTCSHLWPQCKFTVIRT